MIARPGAAACIAVLLATVAGCAATGTPRSDGAPAAAPSSAPTPSASPVDSRTPQQILTAGIPTDASVAYRYSITDAGGPTFGVIDPATKTAEYDVVSRYHDPAYTMTLKVLLVGKKAWAKAVLAPHDISGLSYIPRRWMVVNPSKITGGLPWGYKKESDPAHADDIFANVSEVKQTSPGHFTGITDLSYSDNDIVGAAWIEELGDKARKLRFTAVLDATGRLTAASVTLPASAKLSAFTYKFVYQYTEVTVPTAPNGTTKAIPVVYTWLGS